MTEAWLFDFGNTRLKGAPYAAGAVGDVRAFDPTDLSALPRGDVAYVSSVAPDADRIALLDVLAQRFHRIALARTTARFEDFRIAYAQPNKLGVDRFLAMIAARAAAPALVVGVGTALTIDLLDAQGQHAGGRIAPSPTMMRAALHARAAQLPPTGGGYVEFADDTEDALASGCEGAAIALIERSRAQAAQRFGAMPRVLLHGGGADALRPHLGDVQSRPALVLEGLARWAALEAAA